MFLKTPFGMSFGRSHHFLWNLMRTTLFKSVASFSIRKVISFTLCLDFTLFLPVFKPYINTSIIEAVKYFLVAKSSKIKAEKISEFHLIDFISWE